MDPREIKPLKLKKEDIWDSAERFRKENVFSDTIPVDIERAVEATLGVTFITLPKLQKDFDIDGFITKDFKTLYVDQDLYSDEKHYHRIRFTIAHEIGHYVLHRGFIAGLRFRSDEEWITFFTNIDDIAMSWFESQANEFAGRLLVPLDPLVEHFKRERALILKKNSGFDAKNIPIEEMISITAPLICDKFDVSSQVISKRLQKDKVLGIIGL